MFEQNFHSKDLGKNPTPRGVARPQALKKVLRRTLLAALASTLLSACIGPPALHRSVLGYDETVLKLEQQLLLLNIARNHNGMPVHFTTTSSIAATFDWTTTAGIGGSLEEGSKGLNLNLGASASENPTFSIAPLSGSEFTKRILTPLDEKTFEFIVHQGVPIDLVMRLVSGGIMEMKPDGKFVRFIENHPRRRNEYTEFRQLALHLAWIQANRHLFVRTLFFEDLLMTVKAEPRSEDVGKGFEFGLVWRQKEQEKRFELTKWQTGRVVVTNYDPNALSEREKQELNDKIRKYVPRDFVFLDIRKDKPGGGWPITGGIKLRSFLSIINFIATTMDKNLEFHVPRNPRTPSILSPLTGEAGENPDVVMEVRAEETRPPANVPSVYFHGKYYSIAPNDYSLSSFRLLHYIYQTTVGEVPAPGIPITISK